MIETNEKKLFRGEAALALAVLINSFGVVLMLYSGALILSLMIMRKKSVQLCGGHCVQRAAGRS